MLSSATDYTQQRFERNAFKRNADEAPMMTGWGLAASTFYPSSTTAVHGAGQLPADSDSTRQTLSAAQFHQARWEDVDKSTKAVRGSASHLENNTSLVMTTVEQFGEIVVKRFRGAPIVEPDADTRSVSNRSVTSQSNKLVLEGFKEFRLPGFANEPSELSVLKEVQKVSGEARSEHIVEQDGVSLAESQAFTEAPVNKQLDFDTAEADLKEVKSERLGSVSPVSVHQRRFGQEPAEPVAVIPTLRPVADGVSGHEPGVALQSGRTDVALQVPGVGRYEGELLNGHMCGYGRLYDERDRLLFEGEFVNDLYDGVGVLYNYKSGSQPELLQTETLDHDTINLQFFKQAWDRYEGLFKEGRFHGKGYLHFGARYVAFAKFNEGSIESSCVLKDLVAGGTRKLSVFGQEVVKKSN